RAGLPLLRGAVAVASGEARAGRGAAGAASRGFHRRESVAPSKLAPPGDSFSPELISRQEVVTMSREAKRLLAESLSLPATERAELAARLLASLEPAEGTPEEIEAAWDEEVERRLASMEAGEKMIPWEDV